MIYFCNMNYIIPLLTIFLLVVSCKSAEDKSKDQVIRPTTEYLEGTWKNTLSQYPDFRLTRDTVVFLQEAAGEKYLWSLTGDSIVFHFPTYDFAFKVYCFKGDSIHLDNEMNTNTFLRVKN